MTPNPLIARLAGAADQPALTELIALAITEGQAAFLPPDLIAASRKLMGLDTTLVRDGTYWIVEADGVIAGCGGWSRRATLFGGDHTSGRDAALLDPAKDAARIRAMYTHPAHLRRGIGGLILRRCEAAAVAAGFTRLELAATLAGEALYRANGYDEVERFTVDGVPLIRMTKTKAA